MSHLGYTLMLLGAGQGAILGVVLARRQQNPLANRILAALVAAVAVMLVLWFLDFRWGQHGHPHLAALGAPLPFLFGPLQWLYVVALTRPMTRLEPRQLVHALPFAAYLIYMAQGFYFQSAEEKRALIEAVLAGEGPASAHFMDAVLVVQAISYLAACFVVLCRYRRRMEGYFSDLYRIDLRWLTILVVAHAAVWGIVLVHVLITALGMHVRGAEALRPAMAIGSALLVFVIGYISLWQRDLVQKVREAPRAEEAEPRAAKYQRNRLDEAEAADLVRELEALMAKEELYRDGALTSQTLADALGITPHLLSQVLNVHIGKSFYAYVNSYRAEALKAALANPADRDRGILELALAAGFNSKSTVNSAFKKHTGLTPTQFRDQAMAAS